MGGDGPKIGKRLATAALVLGLVTGCVTIDRVDTSSRGGAADADATAVLTSADGRYVAFQSSATNLESRLRNGLPHVFRKDRVTGALTVVDRRGTRFATTATVTSISADGNLVAFVTDTALAPEDTNGVADVYVRDVAAGHTSLASVLPDGSLLTGSERAVRADFDGGHKVLFQAVGADDPFSYLFLRDLDAGTTTLVDGPGFWDALDLSADGNHVAASANCGTPRVCTHFVYVKDIASPYPYLPQYCDGSTLGGQSADGRFLLVNRSADCGATPALFDRDTAAWLDVAFGSTAGVRAVAVSGDARVVLLTAPDTVVPGGTAGFTGLFSRRSVEGTTVRVAVDAKGEAANASQRAADAYGISGDGTTAVFTSAASNLVPGDTNGRVDAFARVLAHAGPTAVGRPGP